MADFSQTVTNGFGLVGPGATSKWGTMLWGTDFWGSGSQDMATDIVHMIDGQSLVIDGADPAKNIFRNVTDNLDIVEDMDSEMMKDPSGYNYLFPKPTSEAEDRGIPVYTSGTANASTYTSQTAGSTTWS